MGGGGWLAGSSGNKANSAQLELKLGLSLAKRRKQSGAELCQAQFKLWLAKVAVFFDLIENLGCLQLK